MKGPSGLANDTVNRGNGRPKLTVFVILVKSLLFAVGVVIYQNNGKDVFFAELISEFFVYEVLLTKIMDESSKLKNCVLGQFSPTNKNITSEQLTC